MIFKKIIIFFIFVIFITSCAEYKSPNKKEKIYYSSSGFALIYKDSLYLDKTINKKITSDKIEVIHNSLKRNSLIKIINPYNSKFIETKIVKTGNFPEIFNIVISEKIAEILELDKNNPFIEIYELKKNKTFVAKEGSIFEEEINVAGKAPVDTIEMDDLSKQKKTKKKNKIKKNNFILVISDFYYAVSAINLKNELIKKLKSDDFYVKKINNNKHRLYAGPFKNFNSLKDIYISLNNLGFQSLNVYNE